MSEDHNDPQWVDKERVKALLGGCSDSTLQRWQARDDLHFPRPIRVGLKRLWNLSEVEEFMRRLEAQREHGHAA